ncbi:MAG: polysaccharide deacetylase family protein [candidate division WOR-3 bacterium]
MREGVTTTIESYADLLAIEKPLNPIPWEEYLFDLDRKPSRVKKGKIKFLLPEKKEIFSGVGIIELEKEGFLNQKGLYVDAKEKKIIFPFSLKSALSDIRVKPRYFYYHPKKFPYEFVSAVSKGEIRKLFFNALRQICLWEDMEYQHLWYYPQNFLSVFIFRVDTDFAREREIKITYEILKEVGINATWFINTKEHQRLIPFFTQLRKEGEDIQLHCYTHNLFPDYQSNYLNIQKGKEILEKEGIMVKGFASPFGLFNESLYRVLSDLGFSFSSEFALSYDDFPFYPEIRGRKFPILQIPIHPIGFGRLLEAGFNEEEIFAYYKNYIDWRYKNSLPIVIYDHPHRIAQFPQLFRSILKYACGKRKIWLTTMTDFYEWWKRREGNEGAIHIIKGEKEIFRNGEESFQPKMENYFPYHPERIKRMRLGFFPNWRLRAKSIFWRLNKYLKGKIR